MRLNLVCILFCSFLSNILFAQDLADKINIKVVMPVEKGNLISEYYSKAHSASFTAAINDMKKDPKYDNLNIQIQTKYINCGNFDEYFEYLKDNKINFVLNSVICDLPPKDVYQRYVDSEVTQFTFKPLSEAELDNVNHSILSLFESTEKQEEVMLGFLNENKWDNFLVVENFKDSSSSYNVNQKLKSSGKNILNTIDNNAEIYQSNSSWMQNVDNKIDSVIWLLSSQSFLKFEKNLVKKEAYKNKNFLGRMGFCNNAIGANFQQVISNNIYCLSTITYEEPNFINDSLNGIFTAVRQDLFQTVRKGKSKFLGSRIIRAYVSLFLIADAALKYKTNNGLIIRKNLIENKWDSVLGKVGFSKKGFFDNSPTVIRKLNMKDGSFDIVYPKEFAN